MVMRVIKLLIAALCLIPLTCSGAVVSQSSPTDGMGIGDGVYREGFDLEAGSVFVVHLACAEEVLGEEISVILTDMNSMESRVVGQFEAHPSMAIPTTVMSDARYTVQIVGSGGESMEGLISVSYESEITVDGSDQPDLIQPIQL